MLAQKVSEPAYARQVMYFDFGIEEPFFNVQSGENRIIYGLMQFNDLLRLKYKHCYWASFHNERIFENGAGIINDFRYNYRLFSITQTYSRSLFPFHVFL